MCRNYQNQLFADRRTSFFPAQSGKKRVLLYFRICARRANFSHLETLGFGYSSRQDAKNAKFGNLFYFASLREMFRFFLVAASPRWVSVVTIVLYFRILRANSPPGSRQLLMISSPSE